MVKVTVTIYMKERLNAYKAFALHLMSTSNWSIEIHRGKAHALARSNVQIVNDRVAKLDVCTMCRSTLL